MSVQHPRTAGAETLIALLAQDHCKVLHLFERLQRLRKSRDCDGMQMLAEILFTELVIHAQLEREILYPALRRALNEPELLDEAEAEHRTAQRLICALEFMDPEDNLYDAELAALCIHVKRHIEKEKLRIFPRIKQAALDDALVQAFNGRREQLRNEFGMPDEYEESAAPAAA